MENTSMIDRYSHPSDEHKKEAMKKLDRSRTKNVTDFSEGEKEEREKHNYLIIK